MHGVLLQGSCGGRCKFDSVEPPVPDHLKVSKKTKDTQQKDKQYEGQPGQAKQGGGVRGASKRQHSEQPLLLLVHCTHAMSTLSDLNTHKM